MTTPEEFINQMAQEAMQLENVTPEEFNRDMAQCHDYLDELVRNGTKALNNGVDPYGLFAGYIGVLTKFQHHELMAFLAAELGMRAQTAQLMEGLSGLTNEEE